MWLIEKFEKEKEDKQSLIPRLFIFTGTWDEQESRILRLIEDQTVTRFANQTSFNPRGLRWIRFSVLIVPLSELCAWNRLR